MGRLVVSDLQMHYKTRKGNVRAVDKVSFTLEPGRALGVVGESGCGKSSLGLTLLRLLPKNGEVVGGSIRLGDQELLQLTDEEFRKNVRWRKCPWCFRAR
jgi:ABC-type dipeptide/oligopeptide/nickel transport system, ATPase component